MLDKKIVIHGLESCNGDFTCEECGYCVEGDCIGTVMKDALILLREQEPVRCRNCMNYNTECCADGCGWCERHDFGTNDEWYCADGEEKE